MSAPSGNDKSFLLDEDASLTLTVSDFGFSDADGDRFVGVSITTPTHGALYFDGFRLPGPSGGPFYIEIADIEAGKLKFLPEPDENGVAYATLTFQVVDSHVPVFINDTTNVDPTPNTFTFNVAAVNDTPSVTFATAISAPLSPAFGVFQPGGTGGFLFATAAPLASGGFVASWMRQRGGDDSGFSVNAQVFDASGARVGPIFLVNTVTQGNQSLPTISALSSGGFVVTWTDASGVGGDASGLSVKAQIFDAVGARVGGEFLVNTTTQGDQATPAVASLASGGFVVAWLDGSPRAQIFDALGARVGGELTVPAVYGSNYEAAVAGLASGGFVICYQDSGNGVRAQIFNAVGGRVGAEFVVSGEGQYSIPAVASLATGGFIVTWASLLDGGVILAQRYDDAGGRLGAAFALGTSTGSFPAVTQLANGLLVAAWRGGTGLVFDADGHIYGPEISRSTSGGDPFIAPLSSGGFVVVTDSAQGQIFGPPVVPTEQTPYSLKGTMTVADVDAGSSIITATLSSDYGMLTVTAGTSGATVEGSGSSDVTIRGTIAQIAALLQTDPKSVVTFTADTDAPPATATVTFTLDDGGATGRDPGVTGTVTNEVAAATAILSIAGVNDAPTAIGLPANFRLTAGAAAPLDLSDIVITDPDSVLTATISVNVDGGGFAAAAGTGVSIGGGGRTLSLTGTAAALMAYFDAVPNIRYTPPTGASGVGPAFSLSVSDGVAPAIGATVQSFIVTPVPLSIGTTATQAFDSLPASGAATQLALLGWSLDERGTSNFNDELIAVGTGAVADGNVYSFGTLSTDRALGTLRGDTLAPTVGAAFTNTSGSAITSLTFAYAVEQWRLGSNGPSRLPDRLDFQISTDATALNNGTWTDYDVLDGVSPVTTGTIGALDGNAIANRTVVGATIANLLIAPGATFWVRWTDFDVAGDDDGLAIDDLAIKPGSLVAVNDAASTNENVAIVNGNLFANDVAVSGTLAVGAVNGVAGNVGAAIALASGARVTVRADGTFDYDPNGAFDSLIASGTALFTGAVGATSAQDSFSYSLIGGTTATVAITINGVASAGDRLLGGVGNDTLVGTTGADYFNLSQGGNDNVTGSDGNDAFFFGAAFTAQDRVDGGAGSNDQLGLQGDYSAGLNLMGGTLRNVEVLAVLPGFSYSIAITNATVAAGQELAVFGGNLLAGNNFTFNGSNETDGRFRMFGGLGTDNFTGGALDDGFYFGPGKWGANDVVVGGGGTNDQLALDGDYAVTIGGQAGVETLVLLPGPAGSPNSFAITLSDGWTAAGATKTVWALNVTTALTINGSAESNGNLIFFGGQNSDALAGGSGTDVIYGGAGGDALTGGAGSDTFLYDAVTDSTGANNATRDRILDFGPGDKIDLSRIDAVTGGADDAFSYIGGGAFTNVAGQLRCTDTGAGGIFVVEGDVNGDGVADFTLSVTMTAAVPPVAPDFIL